MNVFFRISITCACSMHLALFPLDEQTCNLDIASCELFSIKEGSADMLIRNFVYPSCCRYRRLGEGRPGVHLAGGSCPARQEPHLAWRLQTRCTREPHLRRSHDYRYLLKSFTKYQHYIILLTPATTGRSPTRWCSRKLLANEAVRELSKGVRIHHNTMLMP